MILQLLYQNILYRDIIVRYRLQELPLKELMYFLVSNVGKEVSFGKLAKVVGVKNGKSLLFLLKNLFRITFVVFAAAGSLDLCFVSFSTRLASAFACAASWLALFASFSASSSCAFRLVV